MKEHVMRDSTSFANISMQSDDIPDDSTAATTGTLRLIKTQRIKQQRQRWNKGAEFYARTRRKVTCADSWWLVGAQPDQRDVFQHALHERLEQRRVQESSREPMYAMPTQS